jgi:hypothetical protein
MKALSINQPWAWAILYAGKRVENRKWKTNFRGRFFLHAGLRFDDAGVEWIENHFPDLTLPESYQMGGVIGQATITDCVSQSDSPWFFGPYGFVLKDVVPIKFVPCRGMLNFFEV